MKNLLAAKLTVPIDVELVRYKLLYWSSVLNFNMEAQTQSNWCWAATANSVSHFQDGFSSFFMSFNPWSQCKIAGSELSQPCCNTPTPGVCNVPYYLDRALSRTNNFVSMQAGTISWENVRAQLANGVVVGTRIGWSGGGGHFMVIHGVSRIGSTKYFHIDDPIYGKSVLTVAQFSTNYQGSGSWTHTYFTKKYSYFPMFKDIVFNPVLLKPIPILRPLLHLNNPAIDLEKTVSQLELALPHYSYNLKLTDISEKMTLPQSPNTLRIIESEQAIPIALYNLSTKTDAPEVLSINTNENHLKMMEEGVTKLKSLLKDDKTEGELKHIIVPALNIEALWVSNNKKQNDQFYIISSFDHTGEVLDESAFLKLLKLRKEVVEKQDDTMGA